MRAIELVRRQCVTIDAGATIAEAAQRMERTGVGAIVIVRWGMPVGVVTDRDLVTRVLAQHTSPSVPIAAVMSAPVIAVDADADLRAVFDAFRTHLVRRLVIVDGADVVGIVCVDELVGVLTSELADVVQPLVAETVA